MNIGKDIIKIKNAVCNVLIGEKSGLIKFPDRGRYALSFIKFRL